MGSSASRERSTRRSSSSFHRRPSTRGSSSRRTRQEQQQNTKLSFANAVTFNPIFSHKECLLRQLNWWILDGNLRTGAAFRLNKGGPASPSGECALVGRWDYCSLSQQFQSPAPYHDINAAAPELNMQKTLSQAIQAAIQIAYEQPFEDANARTAILFMLERLAYHGLAVRTDVDLFSIYAHLKSMSATGDTPPPEEVIGARVMNILSLVTRKVPVFWKDRMVLADRIKLELPAEIADIHNYYQDLQTLSSDQLKRRLERDKEHRYLLYSRFRLLYPRPTHLAL